MSIDSGTYANPNERMANTIFDNNYSYSDENTTTRTSYNRHTFTAQKNNLEPKDTLQNFALNQILALMRTTATTTIAEDGSDNVTASETKDWTHFYTLVWSWEGICLILVFATLIVITIIGNTLVILAVVTTRRLRTVTNCFVMSLAVADLLVGIFVMPPAIAGHLLGSWQLGWVLCDIWISLDVLLCTASILSLCAISVDRYFAVTQPLSYSRRRRSKRLALGMILVVWVLALAITCPPILGWYEPGRRDLSECRYNRNEGYVIFSAMGSFFIPMVIMIYIYVKISCVVASRHKELNGISKQRKRKFKQFISRSELDSTNKAYSLNEQNLRFVDNADELLERVTPNGKRPTSAPTAATIAVQPSKHAANTHNSMGVYFAQLQYNAVAQLPTACQRHQSSCESTTATTACNQRSILVRTAGHTPDKVLLREKSAAHWQPRSRSRNISIGTTISLKKETKTTQTLSIVVGGFVVCWLPFFVYYLLTPFLAAHLVDATVANALTWLGWLNSAINPFIYAFYSVDFRAAFCRLACKRLYSEAMQQPQCSSTMLSNRR